MTKAITDDSWEFEISRLIEKSHDNSDALTPSEKKRLKELGIVVEET